MWYFNQLSVKFLVLFNITKNHFKNLFFQPYTFNAILAITMLPIVMEKVTKTLYFNPLPPYYDVIIFAASDK